MADEFIKGLGIALTAGFGWMILSSWYNTPTFDSNRQLLHAPPENMDIYGEVAMILRDAMFVFVVLGVLTFWVLIPAIKQYQAARAESND